MSAWFQQHGSFLLELFILLALAVLCYRLARNSRAIRIILVAILVLFSLTLIAEKTGLSTIHDALKGVSLIFTLGLIILFQPELRRSLGHLSSFRLLNLNAYQPETLDVFVDAAVALSRKRTGALFAIERRMELDTHAETGVLIEGEVSVELISSIFHPRTSLHDGGMILDENRIRAAGCVFPLSQRELNDRTLGLRHRAAIGLSEESDCICVVVSEESGQISIAVGGKLEKGLAEQALREQLRELVLLPEHEKERSSEVEAS